MLDKNNYVVYALHRGGKKMESLLKKKREELKLTQEELARLSNVSRQTISLIENNSLDNIESKTMLKLARALRCDVGDIFFKENVVLTQQNKNE